MVQALAIRDGRVLAAGSDAELIDSHSHPIRGGLYYNLELRWDGVPSLADALRMLREQASRTPPNHWVRVVGGKPVYAAAEFRDLAPAPIPVLPAWSPVEKFGGYVRLAAGGVGCGCAVF
jgi:predicted amidohydrolase YtcJ